MKKLVTLGVVAMALFVPVEALADKNGELHALCKKEIKSQTGGFGQLRGIKTFRGDMTAKYRVRGADVDYVNCIMGKDENAVILIDRTTSQPLSLIAKR